MLEIKPMSKAEQMKWTNIFKLFSMVFREKVQEKREALFKLIKKLMKY